MTTFSLVNQPLAFGPDFWYHVNNTLSGSGVWTVVSSSNGVTFQEGNIWTSTSAISSSNAWSVLKHNASSHYLLMQRYNANEGYPYQYGTIKMLSGTLTSGSGSPTVHPTAVSGSWTNLGTDTQWFDDWSATPSRFYMVGQSTGEFWVAVISKIDGVVHTSMIFERFTNTHPDDNDLFGFRPVYASNAYSALCEGYGLYSSLSGSFGTWQPGVLTAVGNNQPLYNSTLPLNTLTNMIEAYSPVMFRNSTYGPPNGIKGVAATLKFGSHPSLRNVGTLLDLSGSKSHVCMSTYNGAITTILPWDGTSDWKL